jgi:all-trans-retinol dehydrogenase (NAD+)
MSQIQGMTALVTGGASGIGLLTGRLLLEAGAKHLVIWDIDRAALAREVDAFTAAGRSVQGATVDITDLDAVRAAIQALHDAGTEVDLLVNNAGIVVGRDFAAHTHTDIRRTMDVNALAPMHLALELLPGMLRRGRGHIVNIASAAGMVSNPGMSVYCASKWSLIGWSDSLRLEMERGRTGVRVTTVAPYYTDTGMFAGVYSPIIPALKPERVARDIVAAVRKDRIMLRLPRIVNALPFMRGVLPMRVFDHVVGEWLRVYHTMSTFRGRTG